MMKPIYIFLTIISLSIFTSCVEEITPNFEFKEQVFISGMLISESDFVSVQVQNTVQVTDSTFNPVNNAKISLFTKNSSEISSLVTDSFTFENGNYKSLNMITPIIGDTYWLEVTLEDGTVLKSEEEILKAPIPILNMEKTDDIVQINFTDQTEDQNFYLFQIEVFNGNELISDDFYLFNDTIVTENLESNIKIDGINDGETVKFTAHNINFNTFQFYFNVLNVTDDFALSSLFLPTNIVGNVTNISTNELALGNFGVSGYSTLTMDF